MGDVITRVMCGKAGRTRAHTVATVSLDAAGLLLTYRASVLTTATDPEGTESNGWHFRASGHDAQMRCPTDELLSIDLWCSRCRKSHPMCVNGAFDAARQRRKVVQLASEGRVDAFWSVT